MRPKREAFLPRAAAGAAVPPGSFPAVSALSGLPAVPAKAVPSRQPDGAAAGIFPGSVPPRNERRSRPARPPGTSQQPFSHPGPALRIQETASRRRSITKRPLFLPREDAAQSAPQSERKALLVPVSIIRSPLAKRFHSKAMGSPTSSGDDPARPAVPPGSLQPERQQRALPGTVPLWQDRLFPKLAGRGIPGLQSKHPSRPLLSPAGRSPAACRLHTRLLGGNSLPGPAGKALLLLPARSPQALGSRFQTQSHSPSQQPESCRFPRFLRDGPRQKGFRMVRKRRKGQLESAGTIGDLLEDFPRSSLLLFLRTSLAGQIPEAIKSGSKEKTASRTVIPRLAQTSRSHRTASSVCCRASPFRIRSGQQSSRNRSTSQCSSCCRTWTKITSSFPIWTPNSWAGQGANFLRSQPPACASFLQLGKDPPSSIPNMGSRSVSGKDSIGPVNSKIWSSSAQPQKKRSQGHRFLHFGPTVFPGPEALGQHKRKSHSHSQEKAPESLDRSQPEA